MQQNKRVANVSQFIGRIYDAALDPARWQVALEDLCRLTDGKAATLQTFDPLQNFSVRLSIEHGTDPRWSELLHTTYASLCPIGPMVLIADVDQPDSIFSFIDEEEFHETRFYREWCQPQDYYDMAGSMVTKTISEVGTFSVMRSHKAGRFKAQEMELFALLSPHVRRAITIAGLLEHRTMEADALRVIMDQLRVAVVLLNAEMRVLKANAGAQVLLEQNTTIGHEDGRLSIRDRKAERAVYEVLQRGVMEPATITLGASAHDGAPIERLTSALLPLPGREPAWAMLLHVPEPMMPSAAKTIVNAFGLTPREIAVLMPLLEGKSITEVAEILGVSQATARTHLQRLLEKTGTSRQADLIRVVLQAMPPTRG